MCSFQLYTTPSIFISNIWSGHKYVGTHASSTLGFEVYNLFLKISHDFYIVHMCCNYNQIQIKIYCLPSALASEDITFGSDWDYENPVLIFLKYILIISLDPDYLYLIYFLFYVQLLVESWIIYPPLSSIFTFVKLSLFCLIIFAHGYVSMIYDTYWLEIFKLEIGLNKWFEHLNKWLHTKNQSFLMQGLKTSQFNYNFEKPFFLIFYFTGLGPNQRILFRHLLVIDGDSGYKFVRDFHLCLLFEFSVCTLIVLWKKLYEIDSYAY
ncbi:hypothetical protein ACJX0J_025086, partial [Zea mays]